MMHFAKNGHIPLAGEQKICEGRKEIPRKAELIL